MGHSQGTTQMFYALSSSVGDQLKDKIKLFIALAPIVSVGADNIGLRIVCKLIWILEILLGYLRI